MDDSNVLVTTGPDGFGEAVALLSPLGQVGRTDTFCEELDRHPLLQVD